VEILEGKVGFEGGRGWDGTIGGLVDEAMSSPRNLSARVQSIQ
jgi:hypothetical protein